MPERVLIDSDAQNSVFSPVNLMSYVALKEKGQCSFQSVRAVTHSPGLKMAPCLTALRAGASNYSSLIKPIRRAARIGPMAGMRCRSRLTRCFSGSLPRGFDERSLPTSYPPERFRTEKQCLCCALSCKTDGRRPSQLHFRSALDSYGIATEVTGSEATT